MTNPLDSIDQALLDGLHKSPRASVSELARSAGVARGTAYARLNRLEKQGVILGYGPQIDPSAAGYSVLAFISLEIAQGSHQVTVDHLEAIPEILEIHTITGNGDLLCRVVATSNENLHEVVQRMAVIPSVGRSQTQLSLHTDLQRSAIDLLLQD